MRLQSLGNQLWHRDSTFIGNDWGDISYILTTASKGGAQHVSYIFQSVFEGDLEKCMLTFWRYSQDQGKLSATSFTFKGESQKNLTFWYGPPWKGALKGWWCSVYIRKYKYHELIYTNRIKYNMHSRCSMRINQTYFIEPTYFHTKSYTCMQMLICISLSIYNIYIYI